MRLVPALKILAAFGAGAAAAAFFLSGPMQIRGVTPERSLGAIGENLPQGWCLCRHRRYSRRLGSLVRTRRILPRQSRAPKPPERLRLRLGHLNEKRLSRNVT